MTWLLPPHRQVRGRGWAEEKTKDPVWMWHLVRGRGFGFKVEGGRGGGGGCHEHSLPERCVSKGYLELGSFECN